MTIEELVTYAFGRTPSGLATRCTVWMTESRRFKAFIETYRDKLRKKVRAARDDAALLDVEAEVATAYRLLEDRRFAVTWEPLPAGGGRGPDFAVDLTTRLRFYVEVTRPRVGPSAAEEPARLASAICAKLGQLQARAINVLALAGMDARPADIAEVMKDLKLRAERREEPFFTHRGFASARVFVTTSYRLSAILLPGEGLWLNPEAGRPLPSSVATALLG